MRPERAAGRRIMAPGRARAGGRDGSLASVLGPHALAGKRTCLVLLPRRPLPYRHGSVELIQLLFQFVVCLL
jgi:hypothetical protein